LLLCYPANEQQQKVESAAVHVCVRQLFETCDPFELLLADYRVELLNLGVVLRIAVCEAIFTNMVPEMPLFHCEKDNNQIHLYTNTNKTTTTSNFNYNVKNLP
jgi:hypothetical protein